MASKGRELNFEANKKASAKMKDVIINIFKQNSKKEKSIIKYIVDSIQKNRIILDRDDREYIKKFCETQKWDYFKKQPLPI